MKIEVRNLSFSYDANSILKDINFDYDSSEFLCIVGPNGGGKSTFLKLLLGLLRPNLGEIRIDGVKPSEISQKIGYVPQHIPINPNFPMRVLDVVLMGRLCGSSFGFYSKDDKNEAKKALELTGMSEFWDRKIGELSGGQRQRVYIARALCSGAKILMLDEPTASIDARGQAEIYEILKKANLGGVGIIMISHDANIATLFASKIAYINKELVLHKISKGLEREFLNHLLESHGHFCDVELALKSCSCKDCDGNF